MKPKIMSYRLILLLLIIFSYLHTQAFAQTNSQVPENLILNQPIAKTISGGQEHVYKLEITGNKYFKVVVQQQNIDITIELVSPNETKINQVTSFSSINNQEEFLEAVKEKGNYFLVIKSEEATVPPGKYLLELKELKSMSVIDENRILARQDFMIAQGLMEQNTPEAYSQALEKYESAANFYIKVKDLKRAANIINKIAKIYLNKLKDKDKALHYYNEALILCNKAGDQYGKATILHNIGYLFKSSKDFEKALDYYGQALLMSKELLIDEYEQATTLYNMGVLYYEKGDTTEAINKCNKALTIFENKKFFNICGLLCNNLNLIYKKTGNKQKLLETYDKQKNFYFLCNDLKLAASSISDKAEEYKALYEKQSALLSYQEALNLYKQLKDNNTQSIILNNIADLYQMYGENYKALDYYQQALSMQTNDSNLKPIFLGNIGMAYSYISDYEKAILYINESIKLYQNILSQNNNSNIIISIAIMKSNLATVYSDLGYEEKSLSYYEEVLKVFKQLEKKNNEAVTLNNIGRNYLKLNNFEKAKEYYSASLKIFKELANKKGQATSLTRLGDIEIQSDNYHSASILLEEALSLRQSIGDKVGEVYTRNLLGSCFQALKKDDEALSNYKQALAISRELADKSGEVLALYNLAYFEQSKKNYLSSIVFIESAIKIIESTRNKLFNKDFQTSFFASNQKFYGLYIESLMSLYQIDPKAGYHIKAFEISEKARARSLLDSIKSINAQVYANISPELVKQQIELENQLSFLTEQIIKVKNRSHTNEELASLEKEFNEAKEKLELLETELASKNPRYNSLTKPVPLVLKEIQEKVLDSDSILIQYFLGDKFSYVWAITEREFFAYSLPKRQEIETLSDKIYSLLTVRNSQQIYESLKEKASKVEKAEQNYLTLSLELSKIILSPIEQHLGNKKRILFCADGKLHFIPFAALPLTTAKNFTPLVANYEISNLPSASTISLIREQIETKLNNIANSRILVVADPIFSAEDIRIAKTQTHENIVLTDPDFNQVGIRGDLNLDRLPFTRKEAEGITTVFEDKVTQLLDQNANKENIKQSDLTQYGAIHFATHSITDNEHPEFSSIVLSLVDEKGQTKPGFLTISDIFKLKTSAQVITLSACSTGLGKEKRGEGIIGLARAFMYSGTPRVVATLWNINDEATSEFMISFYQHLKKGMSPNTALRQAQLVTIKKNKFKSPYYWGAFIIQGEFR